MVKDEAGAVSALAVSPVMDEELVEEFIPRNRSQGLRLTDEGGLLEQLAQRGLEPALEGEVTGRLGWGQHVSAGGKDGIPREGRGAEPVLTDAGPVGAEVRRSGEGSGEPQSVSRRQRQRRLTGVDEVVLSLSARGLTYAEISAHLAEVHDAEVSQQTISSITDAVIEGMTEWQARPLDRVYPVVFIDCINVKVREGRVANRPIYMALAVTAEGHREILGLWAGGEGREGTRHWHQVLTELKKRGVEDVLMLVCDGLKGLPSAAGDVWPETVVETCVMRLLRASFGYAARQDWDKIAKALRPICTAPTEDGATSQFLEFCEIWADKYPAITKLWENAWAEFVPFLQFNAEIRRIVCTT
ncbi:IS256 family transposase, partial [Streptomyces sp. NPDC001719]